nr:hypothetical protein [Lacipirellula parvula]
MNICPLLTTCVSSGLFRFWLDCGRIRALAGRRWLHRILHRRRGPSCEVLVGHLQVVLRRDRLAVADPLADDVHREGFGQFRLPRAPQVVEDLRPSAQPCPFDDPLELSAQVRVLVAIAGDHEHLRPFLGVERHHRLLDQRPGVFQVRPQFREDRNDASPLPFVVLSLRAADRHAVVSPVDVDPTKLHVLGGASQSAKAAQSEQESPLRVRAGFEHLGSHLARDEELAALVGFHVGLLHVGEWAVDE